MTKFGAYARENLSQVGGCLEGSTVRIISYFYALGTNMFSPRTTTLLPN
jgi:hypothetical protein